MGCAQEALEGILSYIHRDYTHPTNEYLEEYMASDADGKFNMDNMLDEQGCAPKCAVHLTFGIELCDIVQC